MRTRGLFEVERENWDVMPRSSALALFTRMRGRSQPVEKCARSGVDLRRWLPWRSRLFAEGVGAAGRRACACANFLGPLPQNVSSRFIFCPVEINSASAFTR